MVSTTATRTPASCVRCSNRSRCHLASLEGREGPLAQVDIVVAAAEPVDDRADAAAGATPEPTFEPAFEQAAEPARVALQLGLHGRVHAAMLQGRTAPLHSFSLTLESAEPLADLTLEITAEPPLIVPSQVAIQALQPGETIDLGPRRIASFLRYDHGVMRALTESAKGTVHARLVDRTGATLSETSADWTVLPIDAWSGLGALPELLAAFVLPNDSAVTPVLTAAAAHLDAATGSDALDGYQAKDPIRALRIAESIYAAIAGAGITYANPPASFEIEGQRVRFPAKIASTRLATCLDLALWAAAALEQVGLHPLIVLTEGHATVATWLTERTFSSPVVDERARFMKRVELAEIVVFDPTCATSSDPVSFEDARARAAECLDQADGFLAVIDVKRARLGGVAPLWMLTEGGAPPQPGGVGAAAGTTDRGASARDLDAEVAAYLEAERRRQREDETPDTRLDRWLRQLLDLTMRNRLLSATSRSKRVLPLLAASVGAIEDRLAAGKSFSIKPAPPEIAGVAEPTDADLAPIQGLLQSGAESGHLYAALGKDDLAERLLNLYREARTAREEGGSNSLYLAIGFLNFRETKQSGKVRRAPLLLIPLELKRQSTRKGYTLVLGADEPRVNVTLLEYLRRDHEIDVTGLDPLPTDENGIDVPLVLRIFKTAIKDEDGWEIDETLQVGLYSFAKYLLWRDLKDREASLRENDLARHLIDRPSEPYPERTPLPDPVQLDETVSAAEVFAPLSYDSTQLSAILAAAEGATMVLEGPPGTGKSQTITNLIAHSIAHGKTVLFVSEKMAALDVVYRRLGALGLGPACLELHSNKANKKAVLAQFKEALDAGRVRGAGRPAVGRDRRGRGRGARPIEPARRRDARGAPGRCERARAGRTGQRRGTGAAAGDRPRGPARAGRGGARAEACRPRRDGRARRRTARRSGAPAPARGTGRDVAALRIRVARRPARLRRPRRGVRRARHRPARRPRHGRRVRPGQRGGLGRRRGPVCRGHRGGAAALAGFRVAGRPHAARRCGRRARGR